MKGLCRKYGRSFKEVRRWYDGYILDWMPPVEDETGEAPGVERIHVYNPMAVDKVMRQGIFESYWSKTGTYDSIVSLIDHDFDGLRDEIIRMISGAAAEVDISTFQNDMVSFSSKDDVLTVLVHLGYLSYDRCARKVMIPNEEIRSEFVNATKRKKWNEMLKLQQKSADLLDATLNMDGETVAEIIEEIHAQFISVVRYHDENSLSSVLTLAYLSAMQYYFKPIRELPAGKGYADFVYLPKPEYREEMPAILVELKWNRSAAAALEQIKGRKYAGALRDYVGKILLVGINYDKKTKKHACMIENFLLDK